MLNNKITANLKRVSLKGLFIKGKYYCLEDLIYSHFGEWVKITISNNLVDVYDINDNFLMKFNL